MKIFGVRDAGVLLLRQQAQFIRLLKSDDCYTRVCTVHSASVGQHIRHSTAHFDCCVSSVRNPKEMQVVRYDQRQRGGELETQRKFAIEKLHKLAAELSELNVRWST